MAAAIKIMNRNSGNLQDMLADKRAELDKYSVVRRNRQAKLKELELELERNKGYAEESDAKLRQEREKVEDLEHALYVVDIAIIESFGKWVQLATRYLRNNLLHSKIVFCLACLKTICLFVAGYRRKLRERARTGQHDPSRSFATDDALQISG